MGRGCKDISNIVLAERKEKLTKLIFTFEELDQNLELLKKLKITFAAIIGVSNVAIGMLSSPLDDATLRNTFSITTT